MGLNILKTWLDTNKMRLNIYKMWLNANNMRLNRYKIWLNTNKMRLNIFKDTLMQIWKSANIFAFKLKPYVQDFTLQHLLLFEICARELCEMFVYKHSATIEYVKN